MKTFPHPLKPLPILGFVVLTCTTVFAQKAVIPETPDFVNTVDPTTLDVIGLNALRSLNQSLNGNGLTIAHTEALESNPDHFEVSPSAVGQSSIFTYINDSDQTSNIFPNTVGSESGHADGVGDIFYGKLNSSNPEGVAYGVAHINNYSAGAFLYHISQGDNLRNSEKVVNQTFISTPFDPTSFAQGYDNYVATKSTIFSSAVGNGGSPNLPATAYNVIGVAAYGGASSIGPASDGRSKPDITAPASATSYSTPLVSGAATILVQAAGSIANANDSRTVKALLLNGAIKPRFRSNPSDNWTHTSTAPLDTRYGSGVLNIFNSYKQLQGGRNPFTVSNNSTTPPNPSGNVPVLAGWDFNTISSGQSSRSRSRNSSDGVNHYFFILPSDSTAYTATTTLTWNRQNNQTSINNLDLFLYSAGGTLFASSNSTVDNVEHLFVRDLPPGRYDLEVFKPQGGLTRDETYALAFNFSPTRFNAFSKKTHSGAGAFNIPLPSTGALGIECRTGGANNDYQIVFDFAVPVAFNSAAVTSGIGSVSSSSGSGTNEITVNLTGVPNAQTITVALFGVNDGSNITDVGVPIGMLIGDVNATGIVTTADTKLCKEQALRPVTNDNFRTDVDASGAITPEDANITEQYARTHL